MRIDSLLRAMNIVILAAGQGKRMRSSLPKVLHPVAGRPMLSHVIRTARKLVAGGAPTRIVVVIGHGGDAVQATFAGERDLTFVRQEPQLGTGHAVRLAAPHLDDNALTVVLYGDVPLVRATTLEKLVAAAGDGLAALTVELAPPTGYGRIIRDPSGRLVRIVEERDCDEQQLAITEVNTGIVAAPTRLLKQWLSRLSNDNAQREYYLTDVIGLAASDSTRIETVTADDSHEVLGVNSKEQLAEIERIAQRRIAHALMRDGATLADPARIDVRGHLEVGEDVAIDIDCVFEGRVVLADGVRIGPSTFIRDCEIGAGSEVLGFSYLEGARIGKSARIGPFARMRPSATLADEVHIGNFVEVKNAEMGAGSKANHLSYVGDATVGNRVNIGAGTIVANYDGVNKHRTLIGDDVHTGSNSVLVAPIEIGDGATIAAGSTISKNAPAGKLTVARAKQLTVDSWKRPAKKSK